MRNIPRTSIPIGKGNVTVNANLSKQAGRGKYVVLRSSLRAGPCKDRLCQIIRGVKISVEVPSEDEDNLAIFAGEGIFLAIDKDIAKSIDKGRQEVSVGFGLAGKLYVKGLNYSD